jgi:uncharacterized protein YjbJ (UPF0337 family)
VPIHDYIEEDPMNWDQVEGNWKQFRGRVKEKWGDLTDDDLDKIAGRRDRLEGVLQERYGKLREDVKEEVDEWMKAQPSEPHPSAPPRY